MGCSSSVSQATEQSGAKPMIIVYGSPQSTCTQRVLTTLIEKGLQYELTTLDLLDDEHKDPKNSQEKQPFGVKSILVDTDGYKIEESRAICRYLENKYKGRGTELIPTGNAERQALFEQAATTEASHFDPYASGIVYERVSKKILNGDEIDEERVEQLQQQLNEMFDEYEKILSEQPFLAGETFTLVDLFHLPYGSLLIKIGEGDFFTSRPHVNDWWQTITCRPSWKQVESLT